MTVNVSVLTVMSGRIHCSISVCQGVFIALPLFSVSVTGSCFSSIFLSKCWFSLFYLLLLSISLDFQHCLHQRSRLILNENSLRVRFHWPHVWACFRFSRKRIFNFRFLFSPANISSNPCVGWLENIGFYQTRFWHTTTITKTLHPNISTFILKISLVL